jgi:hypothetical protein
VQACNNKQLYTLLTDAADEILMYISFSNIFDKCLQLFLMKRGGEEIYVGPLGHNSSELIKYFEVT